MAEKTLHILIVEDSAFAASLIRGKLTSFPFPTTLHTAASIAEARKILQTGTIDLIIADLNLPDGTGTSLLPPAGTPPTHPVLILTSHKGERAAVESIKGGALDFLIKSREALENLPQHIMRILREWRLVIERRAIEKALKTSEERFRSLFEMVAAGMVVLDINNHIVQVNPAFCDFLGYTAEELLNRAIEDVTHPDDRERTMANYVRLMTTDATPVHYEKRYLRKDGEVVWGYVSVARLAEDEKKERFCIALVQDISNRKQAEEQLRVANQELDAFVYTVAHDLRSSLTPMISIPDILRERLMEQLGREENELLGCIEEMAVKMLNLMEDLLSLAQVGTIERPQKAVDPAGIIEQILNEQKEAIASLGLRIIHEGLPSVRIPATFLTQIFTNLIGNAIRYAGVRGSTITIGGSRRNNRIIFFVRDQGGGIPDGEKGKIFDLFYRGTTGRAKKGSGIGLAIIQKIARHYGGRAWVTNAPGGGSSFLVEMIDG